MAYICKSGYTYSYTGGLGEFLTSAHPVVIVAVEFRIELEVLVLIKLPNSVGLLGPTDAATKARKF